MFKNYKLLFVIYFTVINILFLLPSRALPQESIWAQQGLDKIVHAGIFAGLGILLFLSNWITIKTWVWWVVVATGYGWLIEIVQRATGRDFDLWDVVADSFGAVLGVVCWQVYKKIDPCGNRGRNQN